MGLIDNYTGALHRVRAKLYHDHLPSMKGAYIARTDNEASLSIEKICKTMKDRGGFSGKYGDLVENVKQFLDECVYQLCDGFSVNLKYFSIHPQIGGIFASVNEAYDPQKNPVSFRFRVEKPLLDLTRHITVDILGLADANAFIEEFIDMDREFVNSRFIPGDIFSLTGSKIKVAGDDPGCGVFFVPLEDPAKAVKARRIVENSASKIIGVAPDTGYTQNQIEVRTQFTGSGTLLKKPRIITGDFVLESV